jgi:hypothetical protein
LRKWILTLVALPTCSLAQIQSRVDSRVDSRVFDGYDYRQHRPEVQHLRYSSSSCWRGTRMPNGVIRVWNCQPFPLATQGERFANHRIEAVATAGELHRPAHLSSSGSAD